jgi:hypothetical protein
MAQLYASWVHGSAVVPDQMGNPPLEIVDGRSFTDVTGWRRGDGIFFRIKANNQLWFHVPIPTPVIVEDRRATLGRVMALFQIDNGKLDFVQVTDGRNVIFRNGPFDIAGKHLDGLDPGNTFDVNHDGIAVGVCFSLHFAAGDAPADLIIASAGGDFFHNI